MNGPVVVTHYTPRYNGEYTKSVAGDQKRAMRKAIQNTTHVEPEVSSVQKRSPLNDSVRKSLPVVGGYDM